MSEFDPTNLEAVQERIRFQAAADDLRLTLHAQQEMVEENITLDQVIQALVRGQLLENYPQHQRGACCLFGGFSQDSRPLHIVCTTVQPLLIIITVYEPKLPKWITPTTRRQLE